MRILIFVAFVAIVIPLLIMAHRYVWLRLARDTELPKWPRRLVAAVIVAGALSVIGGFLLMRFASREAVGGLYIAAFAWMGVMSMMLLSLLPWEVIAAPGRWRRWRRRVNALGPTSDPEPPADEPPANKLHDDVDEAPAAVSKPTGLFPEAASRRVFLSRVAASTAVASTAGLFVIGTTNALGEVDVVTVPVAMPRLPKALDGFKIVQLTDVHIGPILDARFLDAVVEKVNAQMPDLVVITGDLVDGPTRIIGPDVARLRHLKSRYGTYFCTGNHEYYSGVDDWIPFLDKLGVSVLNNERRIIGDSDASFDLVGIPDPQGRRFRPDHIADLPGTLVGRDPERELVLLAHRPNPIDAAARAGVGLQLSGHTHGGQFFPVTIGAEIVHPYNAGLHRHGDHTQIYVSRGTGFWGPPIRIAAPAEITSLILTA